MTVQQASSESILELTELWRHQKDRKNLISSAEIRKSAPILTRKSTKILHKERPVPEIESEVDDDEVDNSPIEIPNINELDVEIDASIPRAETFENIVAQGRAGGESFTREKVKGRPMGKKQVLEQFRKESASVRKK